MSAVSIRFHCRLIVVTTGIWVAGRSAIGQQQQQMGSSQANQAIQLPASGRSPAAGTVSIQQNTSQGNQSNQPVFSDLIVITGNYQGSVSGASVPPGVLRLTMSDAVRRGLLINLGSLTAGREAATAAAQRLLALSQLLPQITASLSGTDSQINLAKSGLSLLASPSSPLQIPLVIGPFHYVDAQANFNWNAFSLTAIRNYRAERKVEQASGLEAQDARELVVLAVSGSYLQLVSAASRIDSENAQVKYAQASYDQAKAQLDSGTNVLVDATRSLVQLQTEQERLISLQGDFDQKKIAFCRLIGVPQDEEIALTKPLDDIDERLPDDIASIRMAFDHRRDLQSALAQVRAAELAVGAARAERVPTLTVNGFYGVDGPSLDQSHGVFTATGQLNIPIFDGGRTRSDIEQARSTLKQRQAEYDDTKSKVEQDVRNALIEWRTASGQIKLAKSNREYATLSLKQSQDRLAAGVTTSVEVVQAEQQLNGAETDYTSSLFALNLARLYLSRARGSAEADLDSLFGIGK